MFLEVQNRLARRAELLMAGRMAEYCSDFITPCVFYLQDRLLPINSATELAQNAEYLRQALLTRGIIACRPTVTAQELPRGNRFRVWVHWDEIAADQTVSLTSECIHYMRQTPTGPRTEMVHWLRMSMPELYEHAA